MSSIRFPMSLKPIVNRGYSQSRGSNIWRNDVQGGAPRQGRDTYFEPVPIDITLVVSSLGRQAFYSFLNNIHGGADSFIMPQDTGLGIQDHLVWITSQVSDTTSDGINWTISFTATAERTAIQEDTCLTANLPDLYGCYGDGLNKFLTAYNTYATTFPRIWEPNVIASFDFNSQVFNGISFSRASTGTYIDDGVLKNAAVNEPRYEDIGLLIEDTSTNLAPISEDNSGVTVNNVANSTKTTVLLPGFGGGNFAKLTESSVADASRYLLWSPIGGLVVGNTYTASVWVYLPPGSFATALRMGTNDGSPNSTTTNLQPGVNRITHTFVSSTGSSTRLFLWPYRNGSSTWVGVVGRDIMSAGCLQLENSAAITSYIPTSGEAAARSADILTLTSPGAPKRVYREYTPLGGTTPVTETVPYTGVLCPPGNVRVIKVLND